MPQTARASGKAKPCRECDFAQVADGGTGNTISPQKVTLFGYRRNISGDDQITKDANTRKASAPEPEWAYV